MERHEHLPEATQPHSALALAQRGRQVPPIAVFGVAAQSAATANARSSVVASLLYGATHPGPVRQEFAWSVIRMYETVLSAPV